MTQAAVVEAVTAAADVATAAVVGTVVGTGVNTPTAAGGMNWKTVAILAGVGIAAVILITVIRRKDAAARMAGMGEAVGG